MDYELKLIENMKERDKNITYLFLLQSNLAKDKNVSQKNLEKMTNLFLSLYSQISSDNESTREQVEEAQAQESQEAPREKEIYEDEIDKITGVRWELD